MVKIGICCKNRELYVILESQIKNIYHEKVRLCWYADIVGRLQGRCEKFPYSTEELLLIHIEENDTEKLKAAEQLQLCCPRLKLIFLSDTVNNITEIFCTHPSDFLVLPVSGEKLAEALDRTMEQIEKEDRDCFAVAFKSNIFRIRVREILYFESTKRTVTMHSPKESWMVYRKLNDIQKQMPDYFVRSHQSYLVNMNEIKRMHSLTIELKNGERLPISRPKCQEVKERFREFRG